MDNDQVRAAGRRDPDTLPATEPRFTDKQEAEMGVVDSAGRKIQPTSAAILIGFMYIGIAAIAVVVAVVLFR
jgi:hypothetical protein